MSQQPTIEQIQAAWTDCLNAESHGLPLSGYLMELLTLRKARTTWCGVEENSLRTATKEYLEHYGLKLA